MNVRRIAVTGSLSALAALALVTSVPSRVQAQQERTNDLVKIVQESTARFKDVAVAEAEGYKLAFGCVSGDSAGAMGLHYVNLPLVLDGVIDPTKPEIIIYEPIGNGRVNMIGADFLVFADAWDAAHDGPPELMGQLFHHFPAPNRFRLPNFYTLHVWAWKDNPTGAFTNWHSGVSCGAFSGQNQ